MYFAAEFTISWVAYFSCECNDYSLVDGIELKDVKCKVQSNPSKGNLKDIVDKLEQLVREVRKLQEQLVNISSQVNGTFAQNTTHI